MVAKGSGDGDHGDLWLISSGSPAAQLTFTPDQEGSPAWSADGSHVVFYSNREGAFDIYTQAANPQAKPERLYESPFAKYPTDWSRDGRYVIFGELTETTKSDIWALSMADRHAKPLLDTVHSEGYGAISPDGRWLAYQSDESGANEIYVQRFDPATSGTKRRWQVSTGGGGLPRWRGDGGEIFYMTAGGDMMSAAVRTTGVDFTFGEPQRLFETRPVPRTWNLFDVSRDGQKFLVNLPLEWSSSSPITVVANWIKKLNP